LFEVAPTIMVPQTLQFLNEERANAERITSPTVSGFVRGMNYYSKERQNGLFFWKSFENGTELFDFDVGNLSDAVQQLEIHTDINLTFSRVTYLADTGLGPTVPLLVVERTPFFGEWDSKSMKEEVSGNRSLRAISICLQKL
jgi:hypothetical protein